MRNVNIIFAVTLLLGSFFSCKKADERACFKKAGEIKAITYDLGKNIDSLYLNDDLYYRLIPNPSVNQSEGLKVKITGPENLISFIDINAKENGRLTVNNKNKCNFLRSYKHKIYADIFVDSVTYIEYRGSKELTSSDTLFSYEIRMEIKDGGGDVDLSLANGYTSAVISYGVGSFRLKGRSTITFLNCNSNSYCDARNFISTKTLYVNSNTVGEMFVNAENVKFYVEIQQSGNVNYIGKPIYQELKKTGKGELVKLD